MNHSKKQYVPISIILALTLIVISTAAAEMPFGTDDQTSEYSNGQCPGMHHKGTGMMDGPGLAKGIGGITLKKIMRLDLSDAQKKEVANILLTYRDDSRKLSEQLVKAKKAFFETVSSKKAGDESVVRRAFQQMSATMEDLVVQKTKIMSDLKPVLNNDQFKELNEHHQKKSDKKKSNKKEKFKKQHDVQQAMMDTWIKTYADAPKP
jgi:Spy/CpxP family protein refolding chaperone